MSSKGDIERLKRMLNQPGCADAPLPLSDEVLGELLDRKGCFEAAAYEACLRMAENGAVRTPSGTSAPSQDSYWRMMARVYRPPFGGSLSRADEVTNR